MKFFLKLKHWQLFVLLLCTYLVFQIEGTTSVISSQGEIKQITEHNYFWFKTSSVVSYSQEEVSTVIPSGKWDKSVKVSKRSPIMILFIFVLFGWFYVVGVNLNKKLPELIKMNLAKFKWFIFIPIVCMFLFYIYVLTLFNRVSIGEQLNLAIFAVTLPLYLFSVFCLIYCIYFNAKSLKTVELQRPVNFSDYLGEFLLFLFFPIGIWLIQPKINRIFSETT